ncbi:DUF3649 domain-containing protein [Pseudomonas citronellolis]|uniref:DUF3649 domain-containing protein n=1 Tax=Pseudomonas citronellolis TaxID=53408 RepID=UPI0023E380E7|nr:DUF3649 domain-containing protein [Pseudomonas citronellolis]MDF3937191.1 DUF3649 domain-containing protein [Pseudomonas citronellolis]
MSGKGRLGALLGARILSALFGGYALAYTSTAFLSVYLPLARADRVAFASLACFLVWVVAILYVFAARSTWRACLVPALLSAALALAAFLPHDLGVRP